MNPCTHSIYKTMDSLSSLLLPGEGFYLQFQGRFVTITMKISNEIQLHLTLDEIHSSNNLLMIRDVMDLCLTHSTTLVHPQWSRIQEFFYTLIDHSRSENSLYLIIQLLQDHLSDIQRFSNVDYFRQKPYLSHNDQYKSMLNIESNNKQFRTNGNKRNSKEKFL